MQLQNAATKVFFPAAPQAVLPYPFDICRCPLLKLANKKLPTDHGIQNEVDFSVGPKFMKLLVVQKSGKLTS